MALSKTLAEREHMDGVASLGCVACIERGVYDTPAEVHHCGTGAGGRRDHMKVAPLCPYDHRWTNGVQTLGKYRSEIEARWLAYVAEHCPCNTCKKARA